MDSAYKETIRSHILNLKDSRNPLKHQVLSGEVDPVEFAAMVCIYTCTCHLMALGNMEIDTYTAVILFRLQLKWQQLIDVDPMKN